jgi:hypothetical protein
MIRGRDNSKEAAVISTVALPPGFFDNSSGDSVSEREPKRMKVEKSEHRPSEHKVDVVNDFLKELEDDTKDENNNEEEDVIDPEAEKEEQVDVDAVLYRVRFEAIKASRKDGHKKEVMDEVDESPIIETNRISKEELEKLFSKTIKKKEIAAEVVVSEDDNDSESLVMWRRKGLKVKR